jgi:two-component system response regulator VicR
VKKRILVIDDEESYAEVLKINLEETGCYEVDTALDAAAGLKKLAEAAFDLVLLDILLPKIEGHEALAQIKAITNVPIIIMSSYLTPQQRTLIVQAGAASSFLKTDSFDRIYPEIQRVLSL